jgi:periplasmic protein TonB
MKFRKSGKADMENKRELSLRIGMFGFFAIVLCSFTYTEKVKADSTLPLNGLEISEEMMLNLGQEEVKTTLPTATVEILSIVTGDLKNTDIPEIVYSETIKETKVKGKQTIVEVKAADGDEIFVIVENMPEFPGGELALRKHLNRAIKYPSIAQENGIQGKVIVNFVVDKDGNVSNAKIARGVDPSIDKEALRVVMSLPKWKPGMQRGKAVRVSYTVPISFQLQ